MGFCALAVSVLLLVVLVFARTVWVTLWFGVVPVVCHFSFLSIFGCFRCFSCVRSDFVYFVAWFSFLGWVLPLLLRLVFYRF